MKSFNNLILFIFILMLNSSMAQESQPPRDTLFFDSFSDEKLDAEKWNVRVSGGIVNNEQQAYVDSGAVLFISHNEDGADKGALVIQAHYSPGVKTTEGETMNFISGRIDTRDKFEFANGYAAARMKLPAGSGLWPAFWLLGNGRWPDTGEIDIMEYVGETDWTSVALHGPGYSGETPLVNKYFLPRENDAAQWHVYSVEWSDEGFLFYTDDKLTYRASREMVEHYGAWSFDNEKYIILNLALGGAYPVKTNGVINPYPGIPASTIELIKKGDARVLVDWVVVLK